MIFIICVPSICPHNIYTNMAHRISFKKISYHPSQALIQSVQVLPCWLTFNIGASFCQTQKKTLISLDRSSTAQKISFQSWTNLYYEKEEENIQINFSMQQKGKFSSVKLTKKVSQFLKNTEIVLQQQNDLGKMCYQIDNEEIVQVKFLQMKNIVFELMPLVGKNKQMVLEIDYQQDKYRIQQPHTVYFWQQAVRVYINKEQTVLYSLIDQNQQKTTYTQLQLSLLKHEKGFRKNLIMNQDKSFPIGCLQLEYNTQGLVSLRQLHTKMQMQYLYKIEVKRGNMKFKVPCDEVSLKINSNINFIEVSNNEKQSQSKEFEVNNYVYSTEPKCTFRLCCKIDGKETESEAILKLHMLGKFDQRLIFKDAQNQSIIGQMIVNVICLKVETKTLKLTKICLKLKDTSLDNEDEVYMETSLGGVYGRTQQRKVKPLNTFADSYEVKYSFESFITFKVVMPTKNISFPVQVPLEELENQSENCVQHSFENKQFDTRGSVKFQYAYVMKEQNEENQVKNIKDVEQDNLNCRHQKQKSKIAFETRDESKLSLKKGSTKLVKKYPKPTQVKKSNLNIQFKESSLMKSRDKLDGTEMQKGERKRIKKIKQKTSPFKHKMPAEIRSDKLKHILEIYLDTRPRKLSVDRLKSKPKSNMSFNLKVENKGEKEENIDKKQNIALPIIKPKGRTQEKIHIFKGPRESRQKPGWKKDLNMFEIQSARRHEK